MNLSGLVVFAVGIWVTYASVRTIRRIGLRSFSLAVGRLGWDLGKVALGGTAVVAGAVAASAVSQEDDDESDAALLGPELLDVDALDNYYLRPQSQLYIGIAEDLSNNDEPE